MLKTGMSEKIRALRKALESTGGKNQAQPAQQAYGQSGLLMIVAAKLTR
jgi:hypothetical protein